MASNYLLTDLQENNNPQSDSWCPSMNKPPSDRRLQLLSKDIGGSWRAFLLHLDLRNDAIQKLLQKNNGDPDETCFEGLMQWRKGLGNPVTWSNLLNALDKGAGMPDYAQRLRETVMSENFQEKQEADSDVSKPTKTFFGKIKDTTESVVTGSLSAIEKKVSNLAKSDSEQDEEKVVLYQELLLCQRGIADLMKKNEELESKLEESQADTKEFQACLTNAEEQLKKAEENLKKAGEEKKSIEDKYSQLEKEYRRLEEERQKNVSRDWKSIGPDILPPLQHSSDPGSCYGAVDARADIVAVANSSIPCVHLLTMGSHMDSIGFGQLGKQMGGVAIDLEGNILVSDTANGRVLVHSAREDSVSYIEGNDGQYFSKPKGLAVSKRGNVFICDSTSHRVAIFDKCKHFISHIGNLNGAGNDQTSFRNPLDICMGSDGHVHITDSGNSRICTYDQEGKFLRLFATQRPPQYIASSECGHLVISSWGSTEVAVVTNYGDPVSVFERGPVNGVAVDEQGLVYVSGENQVKIC